MNKPSLDSSWNFKEKMKFPNSRAIGKRSSWTEGDETISKRQEQSLGPLLYRAKSLLLFSR